MKIRRIKSYEAAFSLGAAEIDAFLEALEESLQSIQTERQNLLRIRLSMDEALLRFRDHFGEDAEVTAVIASHLGRPYIQIDLEGTPYNPLSRADTDLENWNSSLLTSIGLSPRYSYTGRINSLKLTLPVKRMNPALKIMAAVIAGLMLGILGSSLLPEDVQSVVSALALDPLCDVWNRILSVLSGPVIFFMIITTILNAGRLSERGGDSRGVVARYLLLSVLMSLLTIITGCLAFRIPLGNIIFDPAEAMLLPQGIVSIIPNEVLTPFMEANTPQLLVMAIVIGNALYLIGSPGEELARIIRQINMVGLTLTEWVSRLVPYFVFILIIHEIWIGRAGLFTGAVGISLILSLAISLVCLIAVMGHLCVREKVRFRILFRKLWRPFSTTVLSGTLNESYGQSMQCCVRQLGINHDFAKVSLPHGLVLYMPVSVIGTMVFVLYAALSCNITVTWIWLGTAAILGVCLFVATPPVPGANLLAYIVIFAQLGISKDVLISAMIFDVIFGLFAFAANQTMLQMELVLQADRIGFLNRDALRRDPARKEN